MRTLSSAKSGGKERVGERDHGIHVWPLQPPPPYDLIAEVTDGDSAARGAGRERVLVHGIWIEQIDHMLRLIWSARFAVRSLDPFLARHLLVHFLDVRKFLVRLENDRLDRLLIPPLLHDASDVDDNKLEICRQLVAVAQHPLRLIGELNEIALDDSGILRLIVAFNLVGPTGKIIDCGWIVFFCYVVTHDAYSFCLITSDQ